MITFRDGKTLFCCLHLQVQIRICVSFQSFWLTLGPGVTTRSSLKTNCGRSFYFLVVFASPKFAARKSCRLSFNYKMVGTPSGILSVEVAEEGNSPEPSGIINQIYLVVFVGFFFFFFFLKRFSILLHYMAETGVFFCVCSQNYAC